MFRFYFSVVRKKILFLFILSNVAIAGIIVLQSVWVAKFYYANLQRFEREIDYAFDKAVKKEFQVRNDSLQEMLYRFVLDTNNIKITSKWNEAVKTWVYSFEVPNDTTPYRGSFSLDEWNKPILSQTDTNRKIVARFYATSYRKKDLDYNIIHYDRQNIGKFLSRELKEYEFDTGKLKRTYKQLLAEQDIYDAFYFRLVKLDSGSIPPARSYINTLGYVTASLPTYDISYAYKSIQAIFPSATNYMVRQLAWMIAGSVVLLLIVGFALFYMIRLLQREKKVSSIKNDFINNITHELKTPIATISTAIEAFEHFDALKDEQKTKKYLQTSRQQISRLSDLVTKILNISIYERQEFELKKENIQVDKLVTELVKNFSFLHGDKVTICFEASSNIMVKADKQSLYSAVSNIIDNAIKYSKEHPVINIRTFIENGYCVIDIRDNGIGIKNDDLGKIFEKFYRVPVKIHNIRGYGLGLFYVKSIIEKHKGWYTVQSRPGEGSVFKIALPYD